MKNIKVHFKTRNGEIETVEAPEFNTLMEASRYFSKSGYIDNIDADCGGACSCATCHVYVKEDWLDKLPTKEDGEEDMLDMAYEPKQNSRLSCQLIVSDELNGLEVTIPEKQA